MALLNYLKRIAPQQLMLRMQVFTKNLLSAQNWNAGFELGFSDYQALLLTHYASEGQVN
jgi:hypothetical protein